MPVDKRADQRRCNRADENLSRADEREDAAGDPKVARERFDKDAKRARDRESRGDVGEKTDCNDRPAVEKLRLVGCLLRAGERTHDLSCIKDRIETPRSESYFDLSFDSAEKPKNASSKVFGTKIASHERKSPMISTVLSCALRLEKDEGGFQQKLNRELIDSLSRRSAQ